MVSKLERNKDAVQEVVESTAVHVGKIATIITHAVADVTREIGEIITDGFEMREAARRAKADAQHERPEPARPEPVRPEPASPEPAGPEPDERGE